MRCLKCMETYDDKYDICPTCGAEKDVKQKEPHFLEAGYKLRNRYTMGISIGAGGFGIMYKAWDDTLCTVVAIKEYYPSGLAERSEGDSAVSIYSDKVKKAYHKGMDYFLKEARSMARFNKSDNIVRIQDFFEENNTAYIVMEYLEGRTFKEYLNENAENVDYEYVLGIASAVLNALDEVHSQGIIHRDISPDNIFLCNDGKVKLIDFGAARNATPEELLTKSLILKPGFSPPEQYQSKDKQGPWTDIYAVGATLYRALTGVIPDESIERMEHDTLKSPKDINNNISSSLSSCIMRALELKPELRYKSAKAFLEALNSGKLEKTAKQRKKKKRIIAFCVFLCIILTLAVGGWIGIKIALNDLYAKYPGSQLIIEQYLVNGGSIFDLLGKGAEFLTNPPSEDETMGLNDLEGMFGGDILTIMSNIYVPDGVTFTSPEKNKYVIKSDEQAEIIINFPLDITDGMTIKLEDNVSIRLREDGAITVHKGGNIECKDLDTQIILEGGSITIEE